MSKRNYRKELIKRRSHIAELKERSVKSQKALIDNTEEVRINRTRDYLFRDLHSAINGQSYRFLSMIEVKDCPLEDSLAYFRLPAEERAKLQKTIEPRYTTMLHPIVAHCHAAFSWDGPARGLDIPTKKAYSKLIDIAKRTKMLECEDELQKFIEGRTSNFKRYQEVLDSLLCVARLKDFWINDPDLWKAPEGLFPKPKILDLVRFLFVKYDMPLFFDKVWLTNTPEFEKFQRWYVNVAKGENLRFQEGLPIPLTKKMAHYTMLAPSGYSVYQAIRYGQILAMGGSDVVMFGINGTPLAEIFHNDDFWTTVIRFFIDNPFLEPLKYREIYDFIYAQKYRGGEAAPQPNFSMENREPNALLRQVERWHEEINARYGGYGYRPPTPKTWNSCGLNGYEDETFTIKEILTSEDLWEEGREMRHCVGSYVDSCASGACAVFSLKDGDKRLATIQVDLKSKTVTQARKSCNAKLDDTDKRLIGVWMKKVGIKMGAYV